MKGEHRAAGLVAMMLAIVLLAGLMPAVAFADYTELSVGTVWPSASRTFPREVRVINCDRLIIHEYADFSSREVLSATRGRRFTATGMTGNFIEVQLDGGGVGYGYASYLEPGAELSVGIVYPYSRVYNTPFGGYAFMPYRYWHVVPDHPGPRPHPGPGPHPGPRPQPPVPNPPVPNPPVPRPPVPPTP